MRPTIRFHFDDACYLEYDPLAATTERNDRAALKLLGLKVDVNELATRLRRAVETCHMASGL